MSLYRVTLALDIEADDDAEASLFASRDLDVHLRGEPVAADLVAIENEQWEEIDA